MTPKFIYLFLFFSLLPSAFCLQPLFAQLNIPLEDKIKFEKALEQKIDEVLLKILGPNQARAIVETTIDFTRIEKLQVNTADAKEQGKDIAFKWLNLSEMLPEQQLLPGFPIDLEKSSSENVSYEKKLSYPASIIKKIRVTLILNKTIDAIQAENIKDIVSNFLAIDPKRGDEIIILRSPFASPWKTLWYTPESMELLAKYVILTLIALISLIVVAIGFLKLAKAMNVMATSQATHQVSLEFGERKRSEGETPKPAEIALPRITKQAVSAETQGESEEESTMFNVRIEQLPLLLFMLEKEDPANIALVTAHLEPDVRKAFLNLLPSQVSAKVINEMAKPKYIEPDIIMEIKQELERRINNTIGGVHKILETMDSLNLKAKEKLIENLKQENPALAMELRSKTLLIDDLNHLSDRDLSVLISAIKLDDWVYILQGIGENLKEKIMQIMPEDVRKVINEKVMVTSAGQTQIDDAVEKFMFAVHDIIKKGMIVNPLESGIKQIPLQTTGD